MVCINVTILMVTLIINELKLNQKPQTGFENNPVGNE